MEKLSKRRWSNLLDQEMVLNAAYDVVIEKSIKCCLPRGNREKSHTRMVMSLAHHQPNGEAVTSKCRKLQAILAPPNSCDSTSLNDDSIYHLTP